MHQAHRQSSEGRSRTEAPWQRDSAEHPLFRGTALNKGCGHGRGTALNKGCGQRDSAEQGVWPGFYFHAQWIEPWCHTPPGPGATHPVLPYTLPSILQCTATCQATVLPLAAYLQEATWGGSMCGIIKGMPGDARITSSSSTELSPATRMVCLLQHIWHAQHLTLMPRGTSRSCNGTSGSISSSKVLLLIVNT